MADVISLPSLPLAIMRSNYVDGNKVNWTYWAIWDIELQANFINIAFCKLFYRYFYCLYLFETKTFFLKNEPYFTFFGFGLGWHSVLKDSIKGFAFMMLFV